MTFLIKSYDKRFSNKLTELYIKDKVVYCKGAFGNNFYDPLLDSLICNNTEITKHNIVMLSCGTGITQFSSILTSLHPNSRFTFKLCASFRDKEDAYLANDIQETSEVYLSCDGNKLSLIHI